MLDWTFCARISCRPTIFASIVVLAVLVLTSSTVVAVECRNSVPDVAAEASKYLVRINVISINPFGSGQKIARGLGSGFIFDKSGLIITNAHVAFNRTFLTVDMPSGDTRPARLVGADPLFDLAVIQVPTKKGEVLSIAKFGKSSGLRVGDRMVALGAPLGLDRSVTTGIVSALDRVIHGSFLARKEPLIQTDTPINPGNSGGPLLNLCSEVVGINTAIIADAQNIGFAIPIDLVKGSLPMLVEKGRIIRPWLGFHGRLIDGDLSAVLRIPSEHGFIVEVVEPGSPAEKAGLKGGSLDVGIAGEELLLGGDIVTEIDGHKLTQENDITSLFASLRVDQKLTLSVLRDGKTIRMAIRLIERPVLPSDINE